MQFFMVGYQALGYFFTSTPLSLSAHLVALMLGLGTWAVSALVKLTGPKLLAAMPEFGEDKEALDRAEAVSNAAATAVTPAPRIDDDDDFHKGEDINASESYQSEGNLPNADDDNLPASGEGSTRA